MDYPNYSPIWTKKQEQKQNMSKKVLTEENQSVIIQIVQNGQEHVQKSDRDKGGDHDTDKMCIGRARIHGD